MIYKNGHRTMDVRSGRQAVGRVYIGSALVWVRPRGLKYLSVAPTEVSLPDGGSSEEVRISSNTSWKAN